MGSGRKVADMPPIDPAVAYCPLIGTAGEPCKAFSMPAGLGAVTFPRAKMGKKFGLKKIDRC